MSLDLRNNLWLPVIVTVLTLGLGIVFSPVQSTVGWLPLLVALGICLAIFFLTAHVLLARVKPVSLDMLGQITKQLDRYVEKGAFTWTLTSEQLADFEGKPNINEVWLVTCDLAEDVPGEVFYDVVHTNLSRGIQYTYFIPKSLEAEARSRQLVQNHQGAGHVAIVYLPDDFFFLVPLLDFAIYDPYNVNGMKTGYMGLPVPSKDRIHCLMEPHFVDIMIGKLATVVEEAEERVQH